MRTCFQYLIIIHTIHLHIYRALDFNNIFEENGFDEIVYTQFKTKQNT